MINTNNGYKFYNQQGYMFKYNYEEENITVNPNADITYNVYFDIDEKARNTFENYFDRELPSEYKRVIARVKDDTENNNKVKIKSFKRKDITGTTVLLTPPTYNILRAFSNVEFNTPGDYIVYEIVVENNTDEEYTFETIPNSNDYIYYEIDIANEEKKILPNADTKAYITIEYNDELDKDMFDDDGVYFEDKIIPLYILDKDGNRVALSAYKDEESPTNPNTTAKNIAIVVGIVAVSGVICLILLKSKKPQMIVPMSILALMTVPILINAEYNNVIEIHSHVVIREAENSDITLNGRKLDINRAVKNYCVDIDRDNAFKVKQKEKVMISYGYEYGPDVASPFVSYYDHVLTIGFTTQDNKVTSFSVNIEEIYNNDGDYEGFECSNVSIPNGTTVEINGTTNNEEAICNFIEQVDFSCDIVKIEKE